MKKTIVHLILSVGVCLIVGCSFHRGGVAHLARAESNYYRDLLVVLKTNRNTLELGLAEQLKADLNRQREVLRWERDLAKAEVVLQANEASTNDIKLLLMKTAEADLSSLDSFLALSSVGKTRVQAVLGLYDALIKAVEALATNNQVITTYLGNDKATYALSSLDVPAMVSAISGIRNAQRDFQGLTELSAEQKKKESDRLERSIDQAQKTLINALSLLPKK
jgi:hypothetical protein